jgi:DNA-binding NtrC family response regulator
MADVVLISSHRLPVAGALREAFRAEGFRVELVPTPEHGEGVEEAELVVLTGERDDDGPGWAVLAEDGLGVPLFSVLPGVGGIRRGRELGAAEPFPADAPADEVALVGRRTVERRRLQALTGIVGDSDAIRELLERVVQIAPVDSTVLVTGESGTGKELVARGIHHLSPRKHRAFLAVNVAALSDTLLESELFGHEKGAFTGAIDARKGFFELANRGTLFLDEIGEMPLATQTKLLRVLEQREFLRVGGESPIRVDVRIVAATNRDLRQAVARGEFRRDLYYRLNILDLHLPPLRERRGDIPLLIRHFVREISARVDRPFPGLSDEAMETLEAHDWPGNVRELRNLVESMVVLSPGREILPRDLPLEVRRPSMALLGPGTDANPGSTNGDGDTPRHSLPMPTPTLRPELEFVFRTLVDLRVDMEELRREFEAYRKDQERRGPERALPPPAAAGTPDGSDLDGSGHGGEAAGEAEPPHDAPGDPFLPPPDMTMEELEEAAIRAMLSETGGNRREAAERLGIGERTLYRKIRKFGLD